ncbi:MAG: cytochrome c maturation protein CcmE [Coriobacteriia bacterium]|nr:cytochrome c maturation protein CcmE [Coriobacteriia bacterium]
MNKRARMRLIGVTAIVLIAVIAVFFGAQSQGAYYRKVSEVTGSSEFVGERIKVGGSVVEGSWDKKSNPMRFEIREEDATGGPTIKVVYNGSVPSTFGDGVVAIVTGTLSSDGVLDSDDMMTKCPSKYESRTGATTVASILAMGEAAVGEPMKLTGFVVAATIRPPGGSVRFSVANAAGQADGIDIFYDGALPKGMTDGSQVVIGGSLDSGGVFDATTVAMSKESK